MTRFRPLLALLAIAAALTLVVVDADARPRSNFGSRGTRTYTAPPPTATAPNTAAPINRSMTPNTQTPGMAQRAPVSGPGGFFNRPGFGFFGGLMTGLLGAGLIGMLFGNGLFGGLGGFASILGLIIQIALVIIVARLAWAWWQRRQQQQQQQQQPAYAGLPRQQTDDQPRSAFGGLGGFGSAAPASEPLTVKPEDFGTFERLLGEVQTAYGREDLAALRTHVTPEMLSYYAEELSENASRGVVNELSDVKLLQGDLSESWREGDNDYASVAMRYSLLDRYRDRATGRVSDGNDQPQEATEVWTFKRARGGDWLLSAIQQT
jgi:predicted lipid-binding transport protein (Tim44 family)